MPAHRQTIKTQPMMLATQLVRGIVSGDPDTSKLSNGTDQETVEGLTALSLLLAKLLAGHTGTTVDEVLSRVQDDSIRVIQAGGETA